MLPRNITPIDYLLAKTDSLILRKIVLKYPVKNIASLFSILKFMARLNTTVSTRELYKQIKRNDIQVSLITLNEYLGYFLEEKILTKIPRYEIKTGKTISNKVQYYFSDTAIRDSLLNFQLRNTSRIKNDIYNTFNSPEYNIFTGKNRSFEFDFIIKPLPQSLPSRREAKQQNSSPARGRLGGGYVFFIHVFSGENKYELKKLINKMIKIHQIPGENTLLNQEYKKYIVVESFEKLKIQKKRYGDLEIVEAENFFKNLAK